LLGFAVSRTSPRVLLNFADAAWDEVVRARAEAAEEHVGLLLHLCHMTHAASRQARDRARERRNAGGEGEDELHLCWRLETCPTGSFTTGNIEAASVSDLVCLPH
jgi:hypothetical protein